MILATNWSEAWLMTGMGVGTVFVILILLVLILQIFSAVAAAGKDKAPAPVKSVSRDNGEEHPILSEYKDDMAAIATTLYLYMNNAHDEESGVLTIHMDEHTLWHAELNPDC